MSVHDRLLNSAKSCRIFLGGIEPDVLSFLNCLHKEGKHVFLGIKSNLNGHEI